jgi:hypothetical protein
MRVDRLLPFVTATTALFAPGCTRCGEGEHADYIHEQAQLCNDNGNLIAIELAQPTTEAAVRALVEPIGGAISCTSPAATNCYVVRVAEGGCCSAMQRLVDANLDAFIQAAPAPCSCRITQPTH